MDEPARSLASRAPGARELMHHLLGEIAAGKLHAGVKLPPERELGQRFSISRGSVRRVLADLRGRGLIIQAVGSGTFVAEDAQARAGGPPPAASLQASPAELMEARVLIEPLMPALIARNANAADLALMQRCLDEAEAASSAEAFRHWDGELHKSLALATHNAFFVQVLELSYRMRAQGEWGRLGRHAPGQERRAQCQRQHRAIVDALKDRDAVRARELLYEHLQQVRQHLFEG